MGMASGAGNPTRAPPAARRLAGRRWWTGRLSGFTGGTAGATSPVAEPIMRGLPGFLSAAEPAVLSADCGR
jgi:hypothetical protein